MIHTSLIPPLKATVEFRNSLFSAALAVRSLGFEPGFNPAALPLPRIRQC